MTDRPDSAGTPGSDQTPEIAEVRRLLADARHTEPMPDDVAARMDAVLADLAPESGSGAPRPTARQNPQPDAPRRREVVVPIAAHRRRKVAGLLVAAAAIVVGGVTIAPHLTSSSGSSQATAAQDSSGGASESDLGNTGNKAAQPGSTQPTVPGDGSVQLRHGRVVVRPRHFSTDARQGRDLRLEALDAGAKVPCPDVPGPGRRVAAEYQHAPAVLVYRRVEGSAQVVDLYVCGNDRPVRSTTLPVP